MILISCIRNMFLRAGGITGHPYNLLYFIWGKYIYILELKNLFKEKRNRCRDGEKTMETRPKQAVHVVHKPHAFWENVVGSGSRGKGVC